MELVVLQLVDYFKEFVFKIKKRVFSLNFKGRSKSTVQIGPFPAIERIVAENRFLVLTRLTRTVIYM